MVRLTKAQRAALKRVFDRAPMYRIESDGARDPRQVRTTYREFRRAALPTIGMDDAVVVPWAGMFLVIERDGYVHS